MKQFVNILLIAIAIQLLNAYTFVQNNYILTKEYKVTIQGTSNLHNWEENVQTVSGESMVNLNKDASFDLTSLNIKMNVHSIKSDKGSIMNNNTYKALKADAYPEIIFTLKTPVKSIPFSNEKAIAVMGNLTIAGATRPVEMQVKIRMQEKILIFEGAQTIKMTDYNISPPVALFGTLKTGDEITIHFKTNFTTINN